MPRQQFRITVFSSQCLPSIVGMSLRRRFTWTHKAECQQHLQLICPNLLPLLPLVHNWFPQNQLWKPHCFHPPLQEHQVWCQSSCPQGSQFARCKTICHWFPEEGRKASPPYPMPYVLFPVLSLTKCKSTRSWEAQTLLSVGAANQPKDQLGTAPTIDTLNHLPQHNFPTKVNEGILMGIGPGRVGCGVYTTLV